MVYDGTSLTMTITDTVTNAMFTHTWTIDIPGTIGAATVYAGFTGGTGGITATQSILTWTLGPTPVVGFCTREPHRLSRRCRRNFHAPISITVTDRRRARSSYQQRYLDRHQSHGFCGGLQHVHRCDSRQRYLHRRGYIYSYWYGRASRQLAVH